MGSQPPRRVLLVACSAEESQALREALGENEYDCHAAAGVSAALAAIEASAPELVIATISLPNLAGWTLCRLLRSHADARLRSIPLFVLVRGPADGEAARITAELGGNAVLPFPEGLRKLRDVVESVCHAEPPQPCTATSSPHFDQRHRALFERSLDSVYLTDLAGNFLDVNQAGLDLTGFSRQDVPSMSFESLLEPEQVPDAYRLLQEVLAEGRHKGRAEFRVRRKGGGSVLVETQASLVCDNGKPVAIQGIARDITHHREAEQLRESEANFRGFFESLNDVVAVSRLDGSIVFANGAASRLLGYAPEEMLRMSVIELHPPDRHDEARRILSAILRGERETCPLPLIRKDGTLIPAETHAWFCRWNGEDCVFGMSHNMTAQWEAQQRFECLFRNSPALMAVSNLQDLCFVDVNDAWLSTLGYTRSEVIGRTSQDLELFPESEQQLTAAQKLVTSGHLASLELAVRAKDGRLREGVFSGEKIVIDGQEFLFTVMIDITERNHAERELARERLRQERIVEGARIGTWEWNIQTGETVCNDFCATMAGYTQAEMAQADLSAWESLVHPADLRRARELMARHLCGEAPHYECECRVRHKDGRWVWVLDHGRLISRSPQGEPQLVFGTRTDITERKQAEAQLLQAQKMESIGRLAGGIAHDFNNLLTVINGHCHLLLASARSADQIRESIQEVSKAGERAASLTRQLLAFSRKQVLQPVGLDVNQIVAGMRPILQRLLGETIELRESLQPDPAAVYADPHQLEQVIMNLALNGRDAMPKGGVLSIATTEAEWDGRPTAGCPAGKPGRYVVLRVADTGMGMDEMTQEHIFEPFFTTKESGRGTGLGLSTVQGVVAQTGGHIRVRSLPGRGTTFEIYLPHLTGPLHDIPAPTVAPAARGTGTILVAEDQSEVRRYVVAVLEGYGYRVIQAETAAGVLARCAGDPGRIDLFLTDVVMPDISGRELAQQVEAIRPGIKVLFMSGYTDDIVEGHGVSENAVEFLQKPFSPEELAARVRTVLDGNRH